MGVTADDIRLVLTCGACPEQYDAFIGNEDVGYLRLRHGWFRADYGFCGGETVYEGGPKGDGAFEDDEREHFLMEAKRALAAEYNRRTAHKPSSPGDSA